MITHVPEENIITHSFNSTWSAKITLNWWLQLYTPQAALPLHTARGAQCIGHAWKREERSHFVPGPLRWYGPYLRVISTKSWEVGFRLHHPFLRCLALSVGHLCKILKGRIAYSWSLLKETCLIHWSSLQNAGAGFLILDPYSGSLPYQCVPSTKSNGPNLFSWALLKAPWLIHGSNLPGLAWLNPKQPDFVLLLPTWGTLPYGMVICTKSGGLISSLHIL